MTTLGNLAEAINQAVDKAEEAVTKAVKGSKATPKKAEVSPLLSESFATVALQAGENLAKSSKLQEEADKLKEAVNAAIKQLHAANITVGRRGKCAIATAFYDGVVAGGLSKKVAENYTSVFRKAVENGKPVTQWNASRAEVESTDVETVTGKKTREKEEPVLADPILKAFNFKEGEEFKALCFQIEKDFEDGKIDNIYAGFISFLQFNGVEI